VKRLDREPCLLRIVSEIICLSDAATLHGPAAFATPTLALMPRRKIQRRVVYSRGFTHLQGKGDSSIQAKLSMDCQGPGTGSIKAEERVRVETEVANASTQHDARGNILELAENVDRPLLRASPSQHHRVERQRHDGNCGAASIMRAARARVQPHLNLFAFAGFCAMFLSWAMPESRW
jgi:hypothetical protein